MQAAKTCVLETCGKLRLLVQDSNDLEGNKQTATRLQNVRQGNPAVTMSVWFSVDCYGADLDNKGRAVVTATVHAANKGESAGRTAKRGAGNQSKRKAPTSHQKKGKKAKKAKKAKPAQAKAAVGAKKAARSGSKAKAGASSQKGTLLGYFSKRVV